MPRTTGLDLRGAFSLDKRALALFRVAIAIIVIANALILLTGTRALLSDDGVWPRALAVEAVGDWYWSLYFLVGSEWFAAGVLVATVAAAAAMLFGWKTRAATVVTWILVVSAANRHSIANYGFDTQLTVMLFWAMFLPLGARFSIDAALARDRSAHTAHFSPAGIALMLQVIYLYFFGALLKHGDVWVSTHNAVYYALSAVQVASPLAPYLLEHHALTRALTMWVWWLELLAVVFLLLPRWYAWGRLFALPQLIAMHLGFAVFLSVGLFPLVSLAGLMIFLPAGFWNRALAWWNGRAARTGMAVYYDRDCEFCRKTGLVFRELGLPPVTPVEPAQDDPRICETLEREQSWVVRTHDGRLLTRWAAVGYVWRRSPLLWPLGVLSALPGLRRIGDRLYGLIAHTRSGLGALTRDWMPYTDHAATSPRIATHVIVTVLASLVLLWNVDTVHEGRYPDALKPVMQMTRLTQNWGLFAPRPVTSSEWIVVEGRAEDSDQIIHLMPGRISSHTRPDSGYAAFPHHRWRKLYERFDPARYGEYQVRFFCARGARLGFDIAEVTITLYRQPTPHPGEPAATPFIKADYHGHCPETANSADTKS